jgi:hypothetical protein
MAGNEWMVAQDTFSTDLKDGSSMSVTKGQHLRAGHEVVAKDGGRGVLFKPLDTGEEPEAPPSKSTSKAEAKAPVKAAGKS